MRTLTRLLLTILLLTTGQLSISASEIFKVDGICYNVIDSGKVEVARGGDYIGNVVIPSTVSYEGEEYDVTQIGYRAFWMCEALTSVKIPGSVVWIEHEAFCECKYLKSVSLPSRLPSIEPYAFSKCESLSSISIPSGVTSIGQGAFSQCKSLTSISIPESVKSIGYDAFSACSALISATIGGDNCTIEEDAFDGCTALTSVDIIDGVISIGEFAFANCKSLISIRIPKTVHSIFNNAFYKCISLTSINVSPDNPYYSSKNGILYRNQGREVWRIPGALTSVVIPNGVTTIGEGAFSTCENLRSVTIPGSLTAIGDDAFLGCSNLTTIYNYSNRPQGLGDNCFEMTPPFMVVFVPKGSLEAYESAKGWKEYKIKEMNLFMADGLCYNIIGSEEVEVTATGYYGGNIVIPSMVSYEGVDYSVTSIDENAFSFSNYLTSVTIPESVTSINSHAFYECDALTSVTIPEGVTSIDGWAFYGCRTLPSVTIPESVTSIGDYAFEGCNSLQSVYNYSPIPQEIGQYSFPFRVPHGGGHVYVPAGCLEAYKSADGWKEYYFREMDFFKVNGICYKFIDSGELEVTNGGDYTGDIIIPSTVIYNGSEYNVTSIGDQAFIDCTSLTSVSMSDGITKIGYGAFINCTSLSSVTIPESVTAIDEYAFAWCHALSSVNIPAGVTSIANATFGMCTSLTSVVIPEGVTTIGNQAFYGCTSLTSVTIPESVTAIGDYAFAYCQALTSVTIPDGVSSIANGTFGMCTSLTSVVIPEGVATIGNEVFYGCGMLETIYNYSKQPQETGDNCFWEIPTSMVVYVPKGSLEAYESADGWKEYIIKEMDDPEEGERVTLAVVDPGHGTVEYQYPVGYDAKFSVHPTTGWTLESILFNGMELTSDEDGFYSPGALEDDSEVQLIYSQIHSETPSSLSLYASKDGLEAYKEVEGSMTDTIKEMEETEDGKRVMLEVMDPDHGTVKYHYPQGYDAKFSIHPTKGWRLESVLFNGKELTADGDGHFSTGNLDGDSELQIIYSQIPTDVKELDDELNSVRVYYRDGEVRIENRPASEAVTICSENGAQLYTGFADCVRVDGDSPIVIVRVGAKSYKLVVR